MLGDAFAAAFAGTISTSDSELDAAMIANCEFLTLVSSSSSSVSTSTIFSGPLSLSVSTGNGFFAAPRPLPIGVQNIIRLKKCFNYLK